MPYLYNRRVGILCYCPFKLAVILVFNTAPAMAHSKNRAVGAMVQELYSNHSHNHLHKTYKHEIIIVHHSSYPDHRMGYRNICLRSRRLNTHFISNRRYCPYPGFPQERYGGITLAGK